MDVARVKRQCEKAIDMAARPHPNRGQVASSVRGKPRIWCQINGASSDNRETSGAIVSKLLLLCFCTETTFRANVLIF